MKKNLFAIGLIGLGLALTGVGCGTTDSASNDTAKAEAKTEAPASAVPIPADSPFAKIKMGMGMDEVYALIGQPSDTGHHITGKAFIPYYYGGDTQRTEITSSGIRSEFHFSYPFILEHENEVYCIPECYQ